jgi:hypothetical protein
MTKYTITAELDQRWFNILGELSKDTKGFVWVDVKVGEDDTLEELAKTIERTCRCRTPYTLEKDGKIEQYIHNCGCSAPYYADLVRGKIK